MPVPIFIAAAIAAAGGVGAGIHGGRKMKEANDNIELAKEIQSDAIELFERKNKNTMEIMDEVGKKELTVLKSFDEFADLMSKIQGRPEFKEYYKDGIELPKYEAEELRKVSAGAGLLLGGIGGAALGTAGGFAAAGATTSAVMAFGTASTGTAIATLSGAAASNATLAALGGGAIAAGGGGIALGSAVLGAATLGVGLLIGGVVFGITGSKLSDKADEALSQALETESEVNRIVKYLDTLYQSATKFIISLNKLYEQYQQRINKLKLTVNYSNKTDWDDFTDEERKNVKNLVLLVGILYKMCQIQLVLKNKNEKELNTVNNSEIERVVLEADSVLDKIGNN